MTGFLYVYDSLRTISNALSGDIPGVPLFPSLATSASGAEVQAWS